MSTLRGMVGPVGRLMHLDASREACVVTCVCGFRALTPSRPMAAAIIDRHRALMHPRQATYVASKRRARRVSA